MTREEAKALLPIIQAYAEGKTIQTKIKTDSTGRTEAWVDVINPDLDGNPGCYRIKPKPKYRPFKDAAECWQEMQKHQPFGWIAKGMKLYAIKVIECNTVFIDDGCENRALIGYFKDSFTFADGTPFGIMEESE